MIILSHVHYRGERGGLRDVKQLAQSHTATKWQSQDSHPELSKAKLMLLSYSLLPWPTEGRWTQGSGDDLAL